MLAVFPMFGWVENSITKLALKNGNGLMDLHVCFFNCKKILAIVNLEIKLVAMDSSLLTLNYIGIIYT